MALRRSPLFPTLLLLAAGFLPGTSAAEPAVALAGRLPAAEEHDLQREARLIVDLLQNLHYSDRTFRDIDAAEALDRYAEALDPGGWFLPRDDRDFLKRRFGRVLKSVYVLKGDVAPAYEIYELFVRRVQARCDRVAQRLDQPFDFTADEQFRPADWKNPPADLAEADRRWEARLKDELLQEQLAGRAPPAALAAAKTRHERLRRQLVGLDALTVRELYLETLIASFDAHSGYFSADSAHEFQVGMAGTVCGVGLDLCKQDGRCLVSAIAPGSPADGQDELHSGDQIVATAEGDGTWVPTTGRRLRDIVAAVRGEPDTRIRLAYLPAGGAERRELTLTRTRIVLEETRARAAVATVPSPTADRPAHRIGWIELPSFYANEDKTAPSSAARDLRELLVQMQPPGLDGLVLDLRRNPGGAMPEALALAGLFLPEGVVFLARDQNGTVTAERIPAGTPAYAGPLVVLVSSASASASEVLSGALRYHHRALVVGSPRTFGKGSMQNYIDLALSPARGAGSPAAWGVLRLTAQRFAAPDGAGPQYCGIPADVPFYDLQPGEVKLEPDLPHALPAEQLAVPAGVAPATGAFARLDPATTAQLAARHTARAAAWPELALWAGEQQLRRDWDEEKPRSLRLDQRRHDQAELEARLAELRRQRRALAAAAAYPTTAFDLPAVRTAQENRRQLLASRQHADSPNVRLAGNSLLARTPDGRFREVPLALIDFRACAADAPALCAAFSAAAGQPADVAEFATLLPELALLPECNEAALRTCLLQHFPAERLAPAALERGLAALLQEILALDSELLAERPALDVNLRESLRLAADWAELPPDAPIRRGE